MTSERNTNIFLINDNFHSHNEILNILLFLSAKRFSVLLLIFTELCLSIYKTIHGFYKPEEGKNCGKKMLVTSMFSFFHIVYSLVPA